MIHALPGGAVRRRVLLTDHPWPDLDIERSILEGAGLELVAGPVKAGTAEEVEALVAEHDPTAVVTCWAPVSESAVRKPSDLRIVARLGVGVDNIAVAAATARGTWVTNVPDYCVEEVSTHALALLLAHFRGVAALDREAKAGRWQPEAVQLRRMSELTIGILGYGRIGRVTAQKLGALGCRLLVYDRAPIDAGEFEQVSLETVQHESDGNERTIPTSCQ
jgi:D-3-phosphoglycerate dehydrogenase